MADLYEYKVAFYTLSFTGIDPRKMQEESNELAAQGWRIRSSLGTHSNQIVVFWERRRT